MMKLNLPHFLFALLIAACAVAAQAVGFQTITVADPDGAPLEVGVWYPSAVAPVPLSIGPITQNVALGGAIAGTALPLVVMS
ncbi:MAG: dienelactone hydrolase, partial [Pseudomonadota bacterium]